MEKANLTVCVGSAEILFWTLFNVVSQEKVVILLFIQCETGDINLW